MDSIREVQRHFWGLALSLQLLQLCISLAWCNCGQGIFDLLLQNFFLRTHFDPQLCPSCWCEPMRTGFSPLLTEDCVYSKISINWVYVLWGGVVGGVLERWRLLGWGVKCSQAPPACCPSRVVKAWEKLSGETLTWLGYWKAETYATVTQHLSNLIYHRDPPLLTLLPSQHVLTSQGNQPS